MGHDTITIASMNAAREGFQSLPKTDRGSCLNGLLNGIQPDIGILPGDYLGTTAFLQGYKQYLSPDNEGTLMLYDANKIAMTKQNISESVFNGLYCLNSLNIAWPEVQVTSLKPVRQTVKTFTTVSFHYELFSTTDRRSNEQLMKSLATLAQRIAIVTENPILIAGQIRLPLDAITTILSSLNSQTQHDYLENANAYLGNFGFLPSMAKSSTREKRNNFKLDTIKCTRKDSVVKTWSPQQGGVADCMIASKALEFSEAKGIEIGSVLGQQVKMPALKDKCVYKTEMQIPVRPPRHHGG